MKQHYLLLLILSTFILFLGCQKELSFDSGGTVSVGSLQSDAGGDCLPKTVNGNYVTGTVLNIANNYIDVQINVVTPGSYTIYTDTISGIYFRTSGVANTAGLTTVRLKGVGTPTTAAATNFTVHYGLTECVVPVTITATPGGGGGGAAAFTLDGSPATCMSFVLHGTYTQNSATVAATDKVDINVTVTTIGTYSVTTTATNGLSFSGSGTFTTTGPKVITLTAIGTPSASGTTNIPVTAGATSCSFPVVVIPAAASTNDYFPRTANSNWSYQFDDVSTDSILRKVITPTKTALGNAFNIFMITDDAASGFDSSGYYRKAGGDYYEFVDMGAFWGFDNSFWVEYVFLKDNVAAGVSWQSAAYTGVAGAQSLQFRLNYKVSQKDISVVVNGVTYTNVIVVDEKLDVNNMGTWVDVSDQVGYFKTYYARNIGMIKQESIDINNAVDGKMEMRRYQVQ
jgi:hypothetical protein